VRATDGDTRLGGEDIDARLVDHFLEVFKTQTGACVCGCVCACVCACVCVRGRERVCVCVCVVTQLGDKDIDASLVGYFHKLFKMKLGVCMYAYVYVYVCVCVCVRCKSFGRRRYRRQSCRLLSYGVQDADWCVCLRVCMCVCVSVANRSLS